MKKLPAVANARAIMTEGTEWGVWKWLTEKQRVRTIADQARSALDDLEMKVKLTWSDELKLAYNQLVTENGNAKRPRRVAKSAGKSKAAGADSKILAAVKRIKEAEDDAYNAHEDAEDLFAGAERKMSTSLAREAAGKALEAYDLHEAAIRKAEALARDKA
jgi:phosphate uptake regulator